MKGEDLIRHLNSMRLRWLGHVERTQNAKTSIPWIYYRNEKERKAQEQIIIECGAGYVRVWIKKLQTECRGKRLLSENKLSQFKYNL